MVVDVVESMDGCVDVVDELTDVVSVVLVLVDDGTSEVVVVVDEVVVLSVVVGFFQHSHDSRLATGYSPGGHNSKPLSQLKAATRSIAMNPPSAIVALFMFSPMFGDLGRSDAGRAMPPDCRALGVSAVRVQCTYL